MIKRVDHRWGIERHSDNWLGGETKWLEPAWQNGLNMVPMPRLYKTRREAREYRRREFAYLNPASLSFRPDLANQPHGWKHPRVVKVECTFEVTDYD